MTRGGRSCTTARSQGNEDDSYVMATNSTRKKRSKESNSGDSHNPKRQKRTAQVGCGRSDRDHAERNAEQNNGRNGAGRPVPGPNESSPGPGTDAEEVRVTATAGREAADNGTRSVFNRAEIRREVTLSDARRAGSGASDSSDDEGIVGGEEDKDDEDVHPNQIVHVTQLTRRDPGCHSTATRPPSLEETIQEFQESERKTKPVHTDEQMMELVKKWARQDLFQKRKYINNPKQDFHQDTKLYKEMYKHIKVDPEQLERDRRIDLDNKLKSVVIRQINTKRSTIGNFMKKAFLRKYVKKVNVRCLSETVS